VVRPYIWSQRGTVRSSSAQRRVAAGCASKEPRSVRRQRLACISPLTDTPVTAAAAQEGGHGTLATPQLCYLVVYTWIWWLSRTLVLLLLLATLLEVAKTLVQLKTRPDQVPSRVQDPAVQPLRAAEGQQIKTMVQIEGADLNKITVLLSTDKSEDQKSKSQVQQKPSSQHQDLCAAEALKPTSSSLWRLHSLGCWAVLVIKSVVQITLWLPLLSSSSC
jgi:hypothetical protein